MQDYRNLEVWQRSMNYVVEIYRFTSSFPADERYNLVSQIRRASTSIPLNIAEGAGCDSKREFARYLVYAYSSGNEVVTCLELARRLGLCQDGDITQALIEDGNRLCKMLYSLVKKLKATNNQKPKTNNQEPTTRNHKPSTTNQQPSAMSYQLPARS